MPLSSNILAQELSKFMDDKSSTFEGSPETGADFAQKFSSAINTYMSSIGPTIAISPKALSDAQTALQGSLMTVGPPPGMLFPVAITGGMTAYATAVGLGMQPAFTATPPPAPIGPLILASVMPLGMGGAPASTCVTTLASIIDGWFRTGLALNNNTGATIPWS